MTNWICEKCGCENESDTPATCGACGTMPTGMEQVGPGMGEARGKLVVSLAEVCAFQASKASAERQWAGAVAAGAVPFVEKHESDSPEMDRDYKE